MTQGVHLVHASVVSWQDKGVLIRGPSGSGKSDLALRLVDRGAVLIADDYCHITVQGSSLIAHVPETIAGQMEVRGIGIITLPHRPSSPIRLIIDLMAEYPRMPDIADQVVDVFGIKIPRLALNPWEASAPLKVALALGQSLSNEEGYANPAK
jgi:HPr kinase/phosphorylase